MLILNRVPLARQLNQLQNEMNQLFSDVFPAPAFFDGLACASSPPLNVWEGGTNFFIEAELPGFSMSDVDVTVLGDEVTIKAQRSFELPKDATYVRRERCCGAFTRTWTLPAQVDADHVQASLKDGVLLITLPKHPSAQARRIAINAT